MDVAGEDYGFVDFLKWLQNQGVNRLWLVGGATLFDAFEQAGGINECIISLIPHLLGDGVPLFTAGRQPQTLKLVGSRSYSSGLVQLHYQRKDNQ